MNALLVSIMTAGLFLHFVAFGVWAGQEPEESTADLSPFAPPIIREGDIAVNLAEAMGLAHVTDGDEAERLLTEIVLSPRNGWMADYPVTPVVLAELRKAMIESSGFGRLAMTETEALEAFDRLAS